MNLREVLIHYGDDPDEPSAFAWKRTADAIGYTCQTMSTWRARGWVIPIKTQGDIAWRSKGKLKPDDLPGAMT